MPVLELVDATKHALLSNSLLLLNVTSNVKKLAAETEEVMHVLRLVDATKHAALLELLMITARLISLKLELI